MKQNIVYISRLSGGVVVMVLCRDSVFMMGFPGSASGKEPTCQCRRYRFNPWVGNIPSVRKWQPTPVFLPGKFHGQRSLAGYSPRGHKSWTRLNDWTHRHTCCVAREILLLQMGWSVECYWGNSRRVSSWLWRREKWFNKELCPVSVRKLLAPSSICSFVGVNQ